MNAKIRKILATRKRRIEERLDTTMARGDQSKAPRPHTKGIPSNGKRLGHAHRCTHAWCRFVQRWKAPPRRLQRSAAAVDATDATFNRGKLTAVSPPTQVRGDDAA